MVLQPELTDDVLQTINRPISNEKIMVRIDSHMNTHGFHQCAMCDFNSKSQVNIKKHMKECHTLEEQVGAGLARPVPLEGALDVSATTAHIPDYIMNTMGMMPSTPRSNQKQRSYKCRRCVHISFSEENHWEHVRTHIPVAKQRCCTLCSFVTATKHHLNTHYLKHFGSKPFQCDKCSYKCVSQCMLDSHKKSHSTDYRYECDDCSYASKHRRYLQVHLKKYNHQVASGELRGDSAPPTTVLAQNVMEQGTKAELVAVPTSYPQTPVSYHCQDSLYTVLNQAKSILEAGVQEPVAVCPHCRTPFNSYQLFHNHMGLHTPDNHFKCQKCQYDAGDSLNFALHVYQAGH